MCGSYMLRLSLQVPLEHPTVILLDQVVMIAIAIYQSSRSSYMLYHTLHHAALTEELKPCGL